MKIKEKKIILLILSMFINFALLTILLTREFNIKITQKKEVKLDSKNLITNKSYIPKHYDIKKKEDKKFTNLNILIVGNSITFHEVKKEIGWNYKAGMAASNINNDYVHILFEKLTKLNKNVCLRISNISQFEKYPSSFEYANYINLLEFKPDLIIIQIGENLNCKDESNKSLFKKNLIEFVNNARYLNHATNILITTPFFISDGNVEYIYEIASVLKIHVVNLSSLICENKHNQAKYNYQGLTISDCWLNDGIGEHPGDIGMKNIAQRIFIEIDKLNNLN